MKKISFKGKISAKGTFVSFATPVNARGEKGRQLAAKIKKFVIEEAELQFTPPLVFVPPSFLERVEGTYFEGEVSPPAPEWAQIKEALERASQK